MSEKVATPNFCMNCGYNQSADVVLEIDGYTVDPRGGLLKYHGFPVFGLAASELCLLYTLAAAEGRVVPRAVIMARCFGDKASEDSMNVTVSRLRNVFVTSKLPQPVQTFSTRHWADCGFYWFIGEPRSKALYKRRYQRHKSKTELPVEPRE